MADKISLDLRGVDTLEKKLGTLVAARTLRAGLKAAGETIVTEVRQYPPESEANRPPPPYYQRGLGTVGAGIVYKTSENLGKQWKTRVNGASSVTISNAASYSEFVHGVKQALFHKRRGWKQLKPTAERLMPQIKQALVNQWRRIVSMS